MKLSKYYCPWCEGARLEFRDVGYDAPNGPSSSRIQGISLGCSLAQVTNCPDTTGACKTEVEAERYAGEMCTTRPTWEAGQPNRYSAAFESWTRGRTTQRAQAQKEQSK